VPHAQVGFSAESFDATFKWLVSEAKVVGDVARTNNELRRQEALKAFKKKKWPFVDLAVRWRFRVQGVRQEGIGVLGLSEPPDTTGTPLEALRSQSAYHGGEPYYSVIPVFVHGTRTPYERGHLAFANDEERLRAKRYSKGDFMTIRGKLADITYRQSENLHSFEVHIGEVRLDD
jgi:hypothetical protein